MGFEPFIQFMRGVQGRVNSSLSGLNGDRSQHIAFLRQLQREMALEEVLSVPLKKLNVVVFDIETSGFYPEKGDQILSIGAIKITNGQIQDNQTFYSLVHYDEFLPQIVEELTGLNNDDLRSAPSLSEVLIDFFNFVGISPLVAHHANHEKNFLQYYCWKQFKAMFKHRLIDTSFLYRIAAPELNTTRLEDLCHHHNIPVMNRHHALGDARLTAQLWRLYTEKVEIVGCENLQDVYNHLAKI